MFAIIITINKFEEPKAWDKAEELNMGQIIFWLATLQHLGDYSNMNESL